MMMIMMMMIDSHDVGLHVRVLSITISKSSAESPMKQAEDFNQVVPNELLTAGHFAEVNKLRMRTFRIARRYVSVLVAFVQPRIEIS